MADPFDVGQEIVKSAQDVFSTMLMVDLESEDFLLNQRQVFLSNITSMIGLGGDIRGVLAIHCPAVVAKDITSGFLGMEVTQLDDDVKDAMGEIANMVAGNLKVAYSKISLNIELAIPTSVVGESINVNVCGAARAERIIVPLKMAGEIFWIELMYIPN